MIIDLSKFMAIWMIILTMFTCISLLAFAELSAFDDLFYVALVYYESALGSWDLHVYDGKVEDGTTFFKANE